MTGWSRREIGGALVGAAVFALPGLCGAKAAAATRTHRVVIRNFAFVPATVTIRPGDTVEWTNNDIAPHTATACSGAWDTGGLTRNAKGAVVFGEPGRVHYFCAFHPHMTGEIVVAGDDSSGS